MIRLREGYKTRVLKNINDVERPIFLEDRKNYKVNIIQSIIVLNIYYLEKKGSLTYKKVLHEYIEVSISEY